MPLSSGCSLQQALGDGEDFELLLAIESGRIPGLLDAWCQAFPDLPLTVIGRLVPAGEGDVLHGGSDHFRT